MATETVADTRPNAEVVSLVTCQFGYGGLFDTTPYGDVHLVRGTANGTPGPTICGIDRFGSDTPGWSMGGGVTGPGMVHRPCPECAGIAFVQFRGLPISGMKPLAEPFREAIAALGEASGICQREGCGVAHVGVCAGCGCPSPMATAAKS